MNAAAGAIQTEADDEKGTAVTSESSINDIKADMAKKNFNPVYAYFVLFMVLACRILV